MLDERMKKGVLQGGVLGCFREVMGNTYGRVWKLVYTCWRFRIYVM